MSAVAVPAIIMGCPSLALGQSVSADAPPFIVIHPASQSVGTGDRVSLRYSVMGLDRSIAWFKDGKQLPNSNVNPLTIPSASVSDAGQYAAVVGNAYGSVTTRSATISVAPGTRPLISLQLSHQILSLGGNLLLLPTGEGSMPITVRWQKDGSTLSTSTIPPGGGVLNIPAADATFAGTYTVTFSNAFGSASSSAVVALESPTTPIITTHPASQIISAGIGTSLTVSAIGSAPLTYQWYKDGVAIPNSNSSLLISAVAAGSYTVRVSSPAGTATSDPAVLSVGAVAAGSTPSAPVFTTQPSRSSAPYGQPLVLSCYAIGNPAPTYSWSKDGNPVTGFPPNAYARASATAGDAGTYICTATNSLGSVTTTPVTVTVLGGIPPLIRRHPASATSTPAHPSVILTVAAVGTAPLSYTWFRDGQPVDGSDNQLSLYGPNLLGGSFTVQVRNAFGVAVSAPATVSAVPPALPRFIRAPAAMTIAEGRAGAMDVSVDGSEPLTVQWFKNGVPVSAVLDPLQSSSFGFGVAKLSDTGLYAVRVTNPWGTVTSDSVPWTVLASPLISTQPSNAVVNAGGGLTVRVASPTGGPLWYQWYANGQLLADGNGILGANTPSLSLTNLAAAAAGSVAYNVIISSPLGFVVSQSAAVSVSAAVAPLFTTQPINQSVTAGATVALSSQATGKPSPKFQWFKGGIALANASEAALILPAVSASDSGVYTVSATNVAGTISSSPATLAVADSPRKVAIRPTGVALAAGIGLLLTTAAAGFSGATYQWLLNGKLIAGASGSTYAIAQAALSDAGSYSVSITDAAGSLASDPVLVSMLGAGGPNLEFQPVSQSVALGDTAVFRVGVSTLAANQASRTASAVSVLVAGTTTYQWYRNGTPVSGGTAPSLVVKAASSNAGTYVCLVSGPAGTLQSVPADLSLSSTKYTGRLINLSTLAPVDPGTGYLTLGFASSGGPAGSALAETLLLRGVGPGLQSFGVSTVLGDPNLTLYDVTKNPIDFNAGWGSTLYNQTAVSAAIPIVGAFPLSDPNSADSALVRSVNAGTYMLAVGSVSGGGGNVLAEIYDETPVTDPSATPRLINLSCLGRLTPGSALTAGATLGGRTSKTILVRAIGPSLGQFGVLNSMTDPLLTVYSGQTPIASNAGWGGTADLAAIFQTVGAFSLAASGSPDSALAITLAPGSYTFQAKSASGGGGAVLVELYEVP